MYRIRPRRYKIVLRVITIKYRAAIRAVAEQYDLRTAI
jgi:hypothetical protein